MNALFPCCSSSFPALPREGSRCCTVLEMTPSMLTLVACIVAVAAALILHKYWLCIPFGIGALASCHSIFIAYYASATRSIHESSDRLREQVSTQQTQIAQLEQIKVSLQDSVTKLECNLEAQNTNNQNLSMRCEALVLINKDYSKNLDTMCSSLETICTLKDDLQKQLEAQGTVSASLQKSLFALSENAPQMIQLAQSIKELGLSQKLQELEEVYLRISRSQHELGKVQATVEELKKTAKDLETMKNSLKEAQERYISTVEAALSELRREYREQIPEKVEELFKLLKLNVQI